MELYFLDSDFEEVMVLDSFKSLIWADKYWEAGELDLVCAPLPSTFAGLLNTAYFRIPQSPHRMVLETLNIKTDIEDGDVLIIKGRSLESLLDRRIIWDGISLLGDLQTTLGQVFYDNVTNPDDPDRDLPFNYIYSTDPVITAMSINTQFSGEILYDAICAICKAYGLGFTVFYNSGTGLFDFKLIAGKDRSYSQSTNSTVAFTAKLNNLLNSNYIASNKLLKTVCLVAGEEGVGNVRTKVYVAAPGGSLTGLNRREVYLEANINRRTESGDMTEAEYLLALAGKGEEELAKRTYLEAFDGEVDTTMYNYGDDFEMGDILQLADKYGHQTKSRVVEMVYSQDADGIKMYPIFETLEE